MLHQRAGVDADPVGAADLLDRGDRRRDEVQRLAVGGVAGVDSTDDGDGGAALDSPDTTDADGESADGAVSESASDDGAAESTADTDDPSVTAGEPETDTDLDPELLSDEERVEHLL